MKKIFYLVIILLFIYVLTLSDSHKFINYYKNKLSSAINLLYKGDWFLWEVLKN